MPGAEEARSAVLDASIAVRWLVPEPGNEAAAELFRNPIAWLAPRLLATEVAAALRRNVVAGNLRAEFAMEALDVLSQMTRDGLLTFADDENLVSSALSLALTMNHKLPDCLYLALAERQGAALATADRALARLAEQRKISVFFVLSG